MASAGGGGSSEDAYQADAIVREACALARNYQYADALNHVRKGQLSRGKSLSVLLSAALSQKIQRTDELTTICDFLTVKQGILSAGTVLTRPRVWSALRKQIYEYELYKRGAYRELIATTKDSYALAQAQYRVRAHAEAAREYARLYNVCGKDEPEKAMLEVNLCAALRWEMSESGQLIIRTETTETGNSSYFVIAKLMELLRVASRKDVSEWPPELASVPYEFLFNASVLLLHRGDSLSGLGMLRHAEESWERTDEADRDLGDLARIHFQKEVLQCILRGPPSCYNIFSGKSDKVSSGSSEFVVEHNFVVRNVNGAASTTLPAIPSALTAIHIQDDTKGSAVNQAALDDVFRSAARYGAVIEQLELSGLNRIREKLSELKQSPPKSKTAHSLRHWLSMQLESRPIKSLEGRMLKFVYKTVHKADLSQFRQIAALDDEVRKVLGPIIFDKGKDDFEILSPLMLPCGLQHPRIYYAWLACAFLHKHRHPRDQTDFASSQLATVINAMFAESDSTNWTACTALMDICLLNGETALAKRIAEFATKSGPRNLALAAEACILMAEILSDTEKQNPSLLLNCHSKRLQELKRRENTASLFNDARALTISIDPDSFATQRPCLHHPKTPSFKQISKTMESTFLYLSANRDGRSAVSPSANGLVLGNLRKKNRKRPTRYPAGFDPANPGPMPDPERWLPMKHRSTNILASKTKIYRGAQGTADPAAVARATQQKKRGASRRISYVVTKFPQFVLAKLMLIRTCVQRLLPIFKSDQQRYPIDGLLGVERSNPGVPDDTIALLCTTGISAAQKSEYFITPKEEAFMWATKIKHVRIFK